MFLPICFSSVYLCIFKTYSIALSFLSWYCDIFHLLVYFPFIMFPYFLDILDTGDWEQPTLFCIISLSDWSGKNVTNLKNNWPVLHEFHKARIFSNQTKVVFISYLWSVYVLQSKKNLRAVMPNVFPGVVDVKRWWPTLIGLFYMDRTLLFWSSLFFTLFHTHITQVKSFERGNDGYKKETV